MIARTACSTSADASRFVSRNERNFWGKSAARLSRRIGMGTLYHPSRFARHPPVSENVSSGLIDHVLGARLGIPGRSKVGELAFEALDFEPQRGAAGENQCHGAGRGIGLIE